jgi:hypothetical protein
LSLWIVILVSGSGCLQRDRFNKNCEWTGDSAFQLDLENPRDQEHLIQDAQLAEELRVRYADFKHKEATGYEGHGGLLNGGKFGHDCQEKVDGIIARTHGVTVEQIAEARNHRNHRFDIAVVLSFGVLYVLGALWACRLLCRRYAQNKQVVAVATVVTALGFSGVGVQLLVLWATTAEMVRVGNDHLGQSRGTLIPSLNHIGELFVAGIVAFLVTGLLQYRRAMSNEGESEDASPHGIRL